MLKKIIKALTCQHKWNGCALFSPIFFNGKRDVLHNKRKKINYKIHLMVIDWDPYLWMKSHKSGETLPE
jgi:hypothetical protein